GVAAFDPGSGGIVSPGGVGYDINCGVRLLASSLSAEDLEPLVERLADALFYRVPSGIGSRRQAQRLDAHDLRTLLVEGAAWMAKHGYGETEDLAHTEAGGCLPEADPEQLSPRALERGMPQLGSLGSGNHFLEVQVVDAVYDAAAADAMGLSIGTVTVLIHTGSRGLGHQVCTDFVERFLNALPRFGFELPDRQLAAAPIASPEGRAYLGAMAAAANFAFANRQRITHSVREAFEALGLAPRDHGLRVVYDLAHNNAKMEEHGGRRLLVHRKGATRAFPPGHPELPEAYREVGQPVFVPGDMGRYSYVLVGTQGAMRDTFGSSCHGAGRRLSRHKAKKQARHRDLLEELRRQGVVVRASSRGTVAEEMPEAYKDVADVVDTVHEAGIGRKVARLRPRLVVKG
ncbi:MAG: RtcB family protein, partial [Deinococcales bacterium]